MTKRFLHIAVIANDGDNETAEGYILDVVDGAVQDRYVQIVLFDEIGNDRLRACAMDLSAKTSPEHAEYKRQRRLAQRRSAQATYLAKRKMMDSVSNQEKS